MSFDVEEEECHTPFQKVEIVGYYSSEEVKEDEAKRDEEVTPYR